MKKLITKKIFSFVFNHTDISCDKIKEFLEINGDTYTNFINSRLELRKKIIDFIYIYWKENKHLEIDERVSLVVNSVICSIEINITDDFITNEDIKLFIREFIIKNYIM